MYKRFSIIMLAVALSSCGTPQQKASALEEKVLDLIVTWSIYPYGLIKCDVKANKNMKSNLKIIALLYSIGVISGIIIQLIGITF